MAGSNKRWVIGIPLVATGGITVALALCVGMCVGVPCLSTGVRYGLWTDTCAVGTFRAEGKVQVSSIRRGTYGVVSTTLLAHWMDGDQAGARHRETYQTPKAISHRLIDHAGDEVEGVRFKNEKWGSYDSSVEMWVPEVPDGDYRLMTTIDARYETVELETPLSFYAPALVHLVSDRPLYKAGQEVLLRAAVLGRPSDIPVEKRPGRWRVYDPGGELLLDETSKTDGWGVSATTFPLASDASEGTWRVMYTTGAESRTTTFNVRPFILPRFSVEASPKAAWHAIGKPIVIEGTATYNSGAPVAAQEVTLNLQSSSGRWQPPLSWETERTARTDSQGRFEFDLGPVPADLIERAVIAASLSVTDDAGETQRSSTSLILSESGLKLEAVTPFGGGLVPKANNRVYVRVTTPAGQPLANETVTLSHPYDYTRPKMTAKTDVDGVAAIQVDPGEPVTLVRPAPPFRIRPRVPKSAEVQSAVVLPGRRGPSLAERRTLDTLHRRIEACGVKGSGANTVELGVLVSGSGQVRSVVAEAGPLEDCVSDAMRAARFPPGENRSMQLAWNVPDPLTPDLNANTQHAFGSTGRLSAALDDAVREARVCLRNSGVSDRNELATVHASIEKGSRAPTVVVQPGRTRASACVQRTLQGIRLAEPATAGEVLTSVVRARVQAAPGQQKPQALTSTGFRLAAASEEGATGRLDFDVATQPNLRMRVTPTLAKAGDRVKVEFLRGPSFRGELPKKMKLMQNGRKLVEVDVDRKNRRASLVVPPGTKGFAELIGASRAILFVQPEDPLSVELATNATSYRPGETASLTVTTRGGEKPTQASVTLVGVDTALGQLEPLTGPDDWGDVTVRTTGTKAFGSFGPRALQLGQIRGENAAKAAVLGVQNLPNESAEEPFTTGSGVSVLSVDEVLLGRFYVGLQQTSKKVREWEKNETGTLTPSIVAGLWQVALDEASSTDTPLVDGFERPLTLRLLPHDLLVQVDPRNLVSDRTRLPEDVVNWPAWVEENL